MRRHTFDRRQLRAADTPNERLQQQTINDVYMMSPVQVKCLFVIVALLPLLLHIIAAAAADTQPRTDVSVEEEETAAAAGALELPIEEPAADAKDNNEDDDDEAKDETIGRRLTDSYGLMADGAEEQQQQQQQMVLQKHVKPLKNIFMGIYKNYKSTYLGNRTSVEYKQKLRERNGAGAGAALAQPNSSPKQQAKDSQIAEGEDDADEHEADAFVADDDDDVAMPNTTPVNNHTPVTMTTTTTVAKGQLLKRENDKKRPKRKPQKPTANAAQASHAAAIKQRKRNKTKTPTPMPPPAGGDDALLAVEADEYTYSIGPGVNMSLDMSNDVVLVQLDGENLREIFRGHWLSDNTEQGRGKKYDMMSKVLPLFILPFLIQSAIVPFLVTKLKLLLMKSILVGKLAIFLLIISALRNGNKMQSYEVAPSYWASEPSRRSELAAAASSMGYGPGSYRVEGKPAWIN